MKQEAQSQGGTEKGDKTRRGAGGGWQDEASWAGSWWQQAARVGVQAKHAKEPHLSPPSCP